MMYFLEISAANDFAFAFVVMLYGMGVLIAMCLVMGIVEGVSDAIGRAAERKRKKASRNNYVRFR